MFKYCPNLWRCCLHSPHRDYFPHVTTFPDISSRHNPELMFLILSPVHVWECLMCKYSQIRRVLPPWGWRAGGEIEESPHHYWSVLVDALRPPWQTHKRAASLERAQTHTQIHTGLGQFISMQISPLPPRPVFWEESLAGCIFSLYHMENLDCTAGSRAEPGSHECAELTACPNWLIEFYVKHRRPFSSPLVAFTLCSCRKTPGILGVSDVYLHCLKCAAWVPLFSVHRAAPLLCWYMIAFRATRPLHRSRSQILRFLPQGFVLEREGENRGCCSLHGIDYSQLKNVRYRALITSTTSSFFFSFFC